MKNTISAGETYIDCNCCLVYCTASDIEGDYISGFSLIENMNTHICSYSECEVRKLESKAASELKLAWERFMRSKLVRIEYSKQTQRITQLILQYNLEHLVANIMYANTFPIKYELNGAFYSKVAEKIQQISNNFEMEDVNLETIIGVLMLKLHRNGYLYYRHNLEYISLSSKGIHFVKSPSNSKV